MKLSDVKGERTLDVIADIIDPIANIAESDVAKELFARQKLPDGMDARAFAVKRIRKAVPKLLKNHKADILCIMASIVGKPYEQFVAETNLITLAGELLELLGDNAFVELFMQAQTGGLSGSAQGSTAAR